METTECRLCGDQIESVSATNGTDGLLGFLPPNSTALGRSFVQGDRALLHHHCAHHTVRDLIDPDRNWFACQHPDRALDGDVLFELYCTVCEQRWTSLS